MISLPTNTAFTVTYKDGRERKLSFKHLSSNIWRVSDWTFYHNENTAQGYCSPMGLDDAQSILTALQRDLSNIRSIKEPKAA